MGLCLEKIEKSICYMDEMYDANFGEWIRNEDNARVVAYNIKKYVDKYKTSDFIVVVKWIVKDWTLKSIIIFSKKMLLDEMKILYQRHPKDWEDKYRCRAEVLSGLIFTWNSVFIVEFLVSITRTMSACERCELLANILESFELKKLSEILFQLKSKIEQGTWCELSKKFNNLLCGRQSSRNRRTASMLKAYNLS